MSFLKLLALDIDDLEFISARLPDAVVEIKDIDWLPDEKRFIAALHLFAWEEEVNKALAGRRGHICERHLSALQFDCILAAFGY